MELKIRDFDSLTNRELYGLLRLRAEVFIVEQGGCYLDPDGIDCESIHIFLEEADGSISGCIRVFPKADEPRTVQLGRLVVRDRRQGLGRRLMDSAAEVARKEYGASSLYLTGRKSALGFYQKCGYEIQAPGIVNGQVCYYHLRKEL